MEVKISGYLNSIYNPKILDKDGLNVIKAIYIKVLDSEDVEKVKNVLKHWSQNSDVKIYTPVCYADEGGWLIKLSTQKLTSYIGDLMKKTSKQEWLNKKYNIKFKVKKYAFNDKSNNTKINGIHFILKHIDLEI